MMRLMEVKTGGIVARRTATVPPKTRDVGGRSAGSVLREVPRAEGNRKFWARDWMRNLVSPKRQGALRARASTSLLTLAFALAGSSLARAVTIELKDVAPGRVENQRQHADGDKVLPGTPDTNAFAARLEAAGQHVGNSVLLRIFKAEAEVELWMHKGDRYELFAIYPICNWSGTLGPKLAEGDKQTPEGFYTISRSQLHRVGRWPRSLNLGFPNIFDKAQARTGSYILVHGGCSSVGCFAMTNPVIDEIFRLTQAAIIKGQQHVPVHVFPFRMTEANLKKHDHADWRGFWQNLKQGYDAFEETRVPPSVRVCDGRYHFDRIAHGEVGATSPLEPCGETLAAVQALEEFYGLARRHPVLSQMNYRTHKSAWETAASEVPTHLAAAFEMYQGAMQSLARRVAENAKLPPSPKRSPPRILAQAAEKLSPFRCNQTLASCRRFIDLYKSRLAAEQASMQESLRKRMKTANRNARAR